MAGSIVSEPLEPRSGFNWVFLVELLISGILTVFFLFYFNRLFATIVSYGIRAYTWRAYHAYIDIQALQISLLGGRIFFKDIRYHGHNETILIHGGYITWNYWLRRVREAEVFSKERSLEPQASNHETPSNHSSRSGSNSGSTRTLDRAEKGGKQNQKRLPCRISVKVSGVEAFMYNRSPAYDGIIEAIQRKAQSVATKDETSEKTGVQNGSYRPSTDTHNDDQRGRRKASVDDDASVARAETDLPVSSSTKKDEIPSFLRLLPIYLDCSKGAIVVGNEHTQAVMTAQFERATGEIDASPSGPLDVYQQIFNFQFTHPVVHLKPNPDFRATLLDSAARLKQEAEEELTDKEEESRPKLESQRKRVFRLPRLSGLFSKSTDSIHTHPKGTTGRNNSFFSPQWHFPGQERWRGLSRYLDDSQKDGFGEWDAVEYAKTSLIVDCPCINVSFYWDNPGPVPNELENSTHIDPVRPKDINGSAPPEYGMDIQVYGGVINYGPWADRYRAVFQSMFFPGANVDAVPTSPLKPGHLRVLSIFKLYLSIEDDTVLRIPVREPSKDWKWKGKARTLAGYDGRGSDKKEKPRARRKSVRGKQRDKTSSSQNVRPFAWIDIKVSGDSSVNYIMDMVASEEGFQNRLDVDISSTEIFSSVNHGLLWRSGAIGLDCDLSNPTSWNSLRKWIFNISCRDLELFLLRDHLFLLTDLVTDWGSGPPSNYFSFVPFQYLLNVNFTDFRIYLNTNDSNIINNPSELDENSFIVLYGQQLHGDVTIPLDTFRPRQNEIRFDVRGQDMGLEICMPPKHTLNTFVVSKNLAQLGSLVLTGSHTYMTETSADNTDRLFMDLFGDGLHVELYGWLIHYFMKIKDNYFGDDMHFKTLEEFQGLPSQSLAADATAPNGQSVKVSNDLDVILSISVEHAAVLLPVNLYSAEDSLRAEVPFVSADLRFTNYYMDLMVNFSPISLSLGASVTGPGLLNDGSGQTEIFIDSLAIFGHRLFGLPPAEPTYVCNWDFDVGRISGECTSDFIEKAASAIRSFAFTLDDDENTLPIADPVVIHDSTFLRLRTQDIHVWLHVAKEVILVGTGHIKLDFNDLASATFSQRLHAWIPNLTVGAVDGQSASRHRTRAGDRQMVETHAFLQTDLRLNMLNRKLDFTENREKQQAHMREHDQRTNRAGFMLPDELLTSIHQRSINQGNVRPPAMQYPEIPRAIFLFQPSSKASSFSASGYSSDAVSSRGRSLRTTTARSASSSSITSSIRSFRQYNRKGKAASSSKSRTLLGDPSPSINSSDRHYTRIGEEERARRNLPPSSVALSSSLAAPYFPLDLIEPNMSDVPTLPNLPSGSVVNSDDALVFNDVSSQRFDETFEHTSILIGAEPGIRFYCTPEFVRCVSNLVEIMQPHQPEELLDDFQIKVMTKILDHQKRREGKGKTIEFHVQVPFTHIRFQNEFAVRPGTEVGKDQYDVILNQLRTAARIKSFPGERAGEDSRSIHTTLGSIGLSVTERSPSGPNDDVAVQAEIRDLLVWVLKTNETSININFKAFETAAASRKVKYLALLNQRTTLLGEEIGSVFTKIEQTHQNRMRYLAWHLTSVQDRFQDPAFLTKASFALRAVRDHLRSHDSWKIISRFRYIWQSLPKDEKDEISNNYAQRSVECPADAKEKIINMWDRWRTWDLAHVKKSLAMKTLFGSPKDEPEASLPAPLRVNLRAASIKLIVDPGPKQSEAGLRILAVNVALLPAPEPAGLMLVDGEIPKESTIVQINSRESTVHIQWEICELAEILTKMFQSESADRSKDIAPQCPPAEQKSIFDRTLHVVYVTEQAELSLDTINLQSVCTGKRLRLSVVSVDDRGSGRGQTTSVHTHLEQGVMRLLSRSRMLLKSQYDQPSIYFAHHEHGGDTSVPDEIKIAGASRMIKFQVEENILGLIEVADLVLRDEVAYFHEQATALQRPSKVKPPKSNHDGKAAQLPNVTLALLMDEYAVELALLQSLSWSITGSSGRISVVPAIGKNVTLRVDYDLAAHTHRMHSNSMERSNVISSLELPPVNGRLTVTNTANEIRVSAAGIIETIELQGSEIQALIATINKPEITNVVQAIQDDVEILKTHIEEIFPTAADKPVVKTPEFSRDIVFNIQMTLSGINVLASAPGQHPDSPTATLALRLSSIQLKATNIGPNRTVLALPEVVVLLHKISIDLTLSDAETIRRCGNLTFGAVFQATANNDVDPVRRVFRVRSSGLEVNIFADTASAVVDVVNYLQDKIKDLDLSKEKKYLKRLRRTRSRVSSNKRERSLDNSVEDTETTASNALFTSTYSIEILNIYVSWIVGTSVAPFSTTESEDLVLSFRRIDLSTRRDDAARLMIEDMQVQMVPVSADKRQRSANSALLPEVVFNVAYNSNKDVRKIAFHAAGKALDLQLSSRFMLPANVIERSIALAGKKFRIASANWNMTPTTSGAQRKNPFSNKRLGSLLVDANFAGAVVHINGGDSSQSPGTQESRSQQKGRYSQFVGDSSKSSLDLRAPAVALKVEYQDDGQEPSLNAELRVDGSSNTLFPTVVPIFIEISESIKEVVREKDEKSPDSAISQAQSETKPAAKLLEEDNLITADPSTILGRTRLNLGLRICKQEFSLSCQPIARVAAIAKLEDIYITINSVKSQEHGHFFAASAAFEKLETTVQHVYSRESTFGFNVDSVVLSMMNSKHLSGTSGISAILKINPMALQINARQLQDFMLFREIWVPPEIRKPSKQPSPNVNQEPHEFLMQRYQQVTAATAFPWNANVAIADVSVELDLGQAIGKTSLNIHNMWASSKKGVDWEQNLCIGVEKIGVESTGRTSGYVELAGVKVRTSISWPSEKVGTRQTPLIQASIGFRQLRVKAGFDYQSFVIANIANFDFLMYNVRGQHKGARDRLVAILDGDKVHVLCTATSAAQGLALWQALERLVQENQQAYKQSLKDIEKFLRRKSSVAVPFDRSTSQATIPVKSESDIEKAPISLHTDVVVTLRSINLGVFPSTFVDAQVLILEAADAQARFAVALESGKIHSSLGLTLGQLSVALSSTPSTKQSKSANDLTVEDIVGSVRQARGGTILRVPKVIATMHTWQKPSSNHIDYVFKSALEGKVDVGWNYNRISFIRSMWSNHSRTLASRLGKPLPESNIKITSTTGTPGTAQSSESSPSSPGQERITAVVNVPQSKYEYTPLEPPLIETPQLRDMGEATPPLEWIGLHRDRLPNVTHQIVIVTLLEVAREVEEAYGRILGGS